MSSWGVVGGLHGGCRESQRPQVVDVVQIVEFGSVRHPGVEVEGTAVPWLCVPVTCGSQPQLVAAAKRGRGDDIGDVWLDRGVLSAATDRRGCCAGGRTVRRQPAPLPVVTEL